MKHILREGACYENLIDYIHEALSQHSFGVMGSDGWQELQGAEVLETSGKRLGCIIFQICWNQLHIKYLFVEKICRGLGVGKLLVDRALKFGRKHDCSKVYVETFLFQGYDFYIKRGFMVEWVRKHDLDHNLDMYFLCRSLMAETNS